MRYVVGVDVGGSKVLAVLASCERRVELLEREQFATSSVDHGCLCDAIRRAIDRLLARRRLGRTALDAIGLAFPGPVNAKTGVVFECPNVPELNGTNARQVFRDWYDVPISVANDAHAATLAEAREGAGRPFDSFLYVSLGTGIGCGIVINKELYTGVDGAAGELSHVIFPGCGRLHSLASGRALMSLFHVDATQLGSRIESGDPVARRALSHLVQFLGVALADMVTLLNPQAVIVGGGLSGLGGLLLEPLEAEVRRNAFSVSAESFAFVTAELAADSGAIGAVVLCQDGKRKDGP